MDRLTLVLMILTLGLYMMNQDLVCNLIGTMTVGVLCRL